eukprot:5324681-Prymnesium_polylepis.1
MGVSEVVCQAHDRMQCPRTLRFDACLMLATRISLPRAWGRRAWPALRTGVGGPFEVALRPWLRLHCVTVSVLVCRRPCICVFVEGARIDA